MFKIFISLILDSVPLKLYSDTQLDYCAAMPRRRRPQLPEPPPEPPETGPYPKYVYFIRLMHDKNQTFDYTYSSVKVAEEKIALIFQEGYSHDLEIVKTPCCF